MPVLKNNQHERFAQLQAGGKTATDAYIETGFKNKFPQVAACALNKRPEIQDRVLELKQQAAENVVMTKEDYLKFMAGVMGGKPEDASMDNPLCELKHVGKDATPVAVFPSKLGAADQIAKTMGWHKEIVKLEASEKVVEIFQNLN